MLTLAQYLENEELSCGAFAERIGKRLGTVCSGQNVWRWTRPVDHADYCIPQPAALVAIYFETRREVKLETWFRHLLRQHSKRAA